MANKKNVAHTKQNKQKQNKQKQKKREVKLKKARVVNNPKIKKTLKSKTGFDRGLEPHAIVGANLQNEKLVYAIMWIDPETSQPITDSKMIDFVFATEVYQKIPQMAISFFEKHIIFN